MGADFASTGQSSMGALHPKPNSDWEQRRAVRTVAHHSNDAAECIDFLEMLGLDPKKGKAPEDKVPKAKRPVQRKWNPHTQRWMQRPAT